MYSVARNSCVEIELLILIFFGVNLKVVKISLCSVTGADLIQVTLKEKERVPLPTPGMCQKTLVWESHHFFFMAFSGVNCYFSLQYFVHLSSQQRLLVFM